jgi:hypothetical protein
MITPLRVLNVWAIITHVSLLIGFIGGGTIAGLLPLTLLIGALAGDLYIAHLLSRRTPEGEAPN